MSQNPENPQSWNPQSGEGQGSSDETQPMNTTVAASGYQPPSGYQRAGGEQRGYNGDEQPHTAEQQAWYGEQHPLGYSQEATHEEPRQVRKFGAGTLVTGMVLAALIGGGVAAGTTAAVSNSSSVSSGRTQQSTTIVNNTDSVNAVTAAAQKASPSTVTIAASAGQSSGTGSGVVLDNQGHILTNTHVVTLDGQVSNARIQVQMSDGSTSTATLVGTDPTSDLAVIKIDPAGMTLTPAALGDSSKLNVGDVAVAIGSPLGLNGTVTDGIVSNLSRTISVASSAAPEGDSSDSGTGSGSPFQFQFPDQNGSSQSTSSKKTISLNVLQTDAAINPGNSGGPLLNSSGEVIGINVAIASAGQGSSSSGSSTGNIGVGFSIPINYAHRVAQEIIENGKATHGYLGATLSSRASGSGSSSSFTNGAVVRTVESGSPADHAGLQEGDVVTKIAGRSVIDSKAATATVREQAAGAQIEITYQRNGKEQTAQVTLGDSSQSS